MLGLAFTWQDGIGETTVKVGSICNGLSQAVIAHVNYSWVTLIFYEI